MAAPAGPPPAAGPASNGVATLVGLEGLEQGRRFEIVRTAIVGRLPECQVVLTDASVSRRHARIQLEGDRWTVTDLGSTNGLRVNGRDVAAAEVRDGDRVEFGGALFGFSAGHAGRVGPGP